MALFRKGKKKGPGMKPVTAGAIALVVILIGCFFGFTLYNPFHQPYEFTATFQSANNLTLKAPVRIAGVEVGRVTKIEPLGGTSGAANVTMEIEKVGLPIHKDATLKIRPRIFLEGNFFVDVQPGTPGSEPLASGGRIPVNQTDTPVQFGQILTALQSDTRTDLKTFLREYSTNALGNGGKKGQPTGAQYYNQSLNYAPDAFKNSSLANDATLGEHPGDLQRVIRSQQKVFHALSTHPESLKGLVTNLNKTAEALSSDESALAATVPALRDVVVRGRPALASLDSALPTLRAFARDALPGTRSSPATLRASRPLINQLRLLVSDRELKGLTRDLRPTIPALARVNHSSIPLLNENRALSSCQNKVILPFSKTPIPDPDFPANSNQPFYKQGPRGFVGLAGESRIFDANSPLFHVQFSTGATTVVYSDRGQDFFAQAPEAPAGIRPIRPNSRPVFRPDVPCETQQPPDLNAPGGRPDRSITPGPGSLIPGVICDIIGGQLIPCPGAPTAPLAKKGQIQLNGIKDFFKAKTAGKPAVDPLGQTRGNYLQQLKKLGLKTDPQGHVVKRTGAQGATK
ncbi:MAG: phospholipid/cholesterol/gamma-HCH transport system substrate-binding protein [Thermoleophilaceae bacterium]|jgi:ABC-type transporter Mla subunit MlaD|nr:phospholipid/cholesterol/gamma-HCH transport system substrate-binding protein [Thermoleophilaceae bacterium]